jgi:NAD(P)-dependent dehydrogenase (short-subunit alcohol dehydrogenase family)
MTGRVALITGAASGQGDATARVLADEGCRLALCDINSCEDLCAEIIDAGGEAATFEVDLADSASIAQLAKDVLDRFGDVDILV